MYFLCNLLKIKHLRVCITEFLPRNRSSATSYLSSSQFPNYFSNRHPLKSPDPTTDLKFFQKIGSENPPIGDFGVTSLFLQRVSMW